LPSPALGLAVRVAPLAELSSVDAATRTKPIGGRIADEDVRVAPLTELLPVDAATRTGSTL